MIRKKILALVGIVAFVLASSELSSARGFGGGGYGGGGFDRGGGGSFDRGGFDFHNDGGSYHPGEGGTHSSTGPGGTQRTTDVSNTGSGYSRQTTATNGDYSRTTGGSASDNGNVSHYSSGSSPYGTHSSSTSGNTQTGNYSHSGSGSDQYGSYSTSGSGNAYNHTYSGSGTATNAWGQTYNTSTYANNGVVYHGAAVTNPVYAGYPAWGWNGGYPWYPVPTYWAGGFWGGFAVGAATSAVVYGSLVAPNNVTVTSYQVQPESPGAKLLESYKLTQVPCGPPNLVVIYGPSNSVICAKPNALVAAGNYSADSKSLTLTSEKAAT
ncbi:MAG: hypothetical protein JO359_14200 [Candidatus Eremiobacteraeota bacterium]|nr:hypothetical protein [Candidatus Eremiobacteraeota bacterium]